MIPGNIPLVLAGGAGGYQIQNSLRFGASNSAYLTRTPSVAGNRKIATLSVWVKRGNLAALMDFLGVAAGNTECLRLTAGDNLLVRFGNLDSTTNALFRDPSAWGHLLVARDTTQATSTDRLKVWWNNVALTFSSYSVPAQNTDTDLCNTVLHDIGRGGGYFDGYLANFYLIDGQALTPSSFGRTDATTGVWVPKSYSGTYGTNGFFLEFKDASAATNTAIGKDSSGLSNHFTPSGISVTTGNTFDQMTDTATKNYCTLNPLDKSAAVSFTRSTLSITGGSAGGVSTFSQTGTTFGVPRTGKWYFEFTRDTAGADSNYFGVNITRNYRGGNGWPTTRNNDGYPGYYSFEYGFAVTHDLASNNLTWRNNFIVTGASVAVNSTSSTSTTAVYGFAIDCDNSLAYLYENGSLKTNSNGLSFTHPGSDAIFSIFKSDHIVSVNFGQRPFAYTPPTGYNSLNTTNLPTPSIRRPNQNFDIVLRSGTAANASVNTLAFQPDLVWIKSRSATTNNNIFDSSRGVANTLVTNSLHTEINDSNTLISFDSNGFTLGGDSNTKGVNVNKSSYVNWAWKKGVGSGLDIVTFSGTGSAINVSHSLGVVPSMIIIKNRSGLGRQWSVYHSSIPSSATGGIYLNLANAWNADSTLFNSIAPTSTQFSVGTYYSVLNETCVAYVFSEVAGFSRFGSYTGNASTDGPFVWCGFSPKFVMIKSSTVATSWLIYNPSGADNNEAVNRLFSDLTNAEASNTYGIDFLSNGFKVRQPTGYSGNNSGATYIFLAFAEVPFKYARAR